MGVVFVETTSHYVTERGDEPSSLSAALSLEVATVSTLISFKQMLGVRLASLFPNVPQAPT